MKTSTVPMPSLNAAETSGLAELREIIHQQSSPTTTDCAVLDDPIHSSQSDRVLIRFLRARKGNVEDAAVLWDETMQWRVEQDASQWRRNAPGPRHSKQMIELFCRSGFESLNNVEKHPYIRLVAPLPLEHEHSYRRSVVNEHFGHDHGGHPLYWERTGIGAVYFPNLIKELNADQIIWGHIRQQELALAKCEEASIKFNKYIGKQTIIMDMKGMSFWPRAGGVAVFKRILMIDSKYYPETLNKHFIINAPWVFTGVWSMIRPWLDPVTAAKISVMGKNYLPSLLEHIDASQIPIEFGGTSEMTLSNAMTEDGQAEDFVARMYTHQVEQENVGGGGEGEGGGEGGGGGEMISIPEEKDDSVARCPSSSPRVYRPSIPDVVAIQDVVVDQDGHKTLTI